MLNESTVRNAKAREKAYKLFDEHGLFLFVTPAGARSWRLKYRFQGKERLLTLGLYPDVGLKRAREKRTDARKLLADGKDPGATEGDTATADKTSFQAISEEYFSKQTERLAESTLGRDKQRLNHHVLKMLGDRPLASIKSNDLLSALQVMEAQGILESARRVRALCSRIWRYAKATGRAEHDITADLRGAIATPPERHFPAITKPAAVGELLRAIDGYVGEPSAVYALKLAPMTFVRPGELRGARWEEFDFEAREWRIPPERMKGREEHLVPLSKQAIKLLRELQPLTGHSPYLFPSLRSPQRFISDNTINAALRRLGYSNEIMTGHGFRSTASTLLNEQGWHPDIIELQLAHAERNKVRGIYNRAQRLDERRKMMQAWSDYLDKLRRTRNNNVVPFKKAA